MRSLLFAALLLFAGAAAADEAASARAHFDKGTTLYDLGQYREAAHEYEEAFKLKPLSELLFNIAQAYRLAGDNAAALRAYRSYLRRVPQASNRVEAEQYIDRLDKAMHAPPPPPPPTATVAEPKPKPAEPIAPPTAVTTSTSSLTSSPPPRRERTPAYKKWWVWTLVGVAVAGAGVGLAVALTQPKDVTIPSGAHQVSFP